MRPGKRTMIGATAGILATLALLVSLLWHEAPVDPQLRQQLAQAREQRLADLESYIKQGEFPHNHDFEGEQVPYLADRHGRLCAVAYLFSASQVEDFDYSTFVLVNQVAARSPNASYGERPEQRFARSFLQDDSPAAEVQSRLEKQYYESEAWNEARLRKALTQLQERKSHALAEQVEEELRDLEARRADGSDARAAIDAIRKCGKHRAWFQSLPTLAGTDNHVRVKQLKPGPLWDWILTSGLTREECAMIQPNYSYLEVTCDHCVPGSEAQMRHLEGADYYRTILSEQERVRAHLTGVMRKLRETSDRSLDLATRRLQQSAVQPAPATATVISPGP